VRAGGIGFQQKIEDIGSGQIDIRTELLQNALTIYVILTYLLVPGLNGSENGNGIQAGHGEQQQNPPEAHQEQTTGLRSSITHVGAGSRVCEKSTDCSSVQLAGRVLERRVGLLVFIFCAHVFYLSLR